MATKRPEDSRSLRSFHHVRPMGAPPALDADDRATANTAVKEMTDFANLLVNEALGTLARVTDVADRLCGVLPEPGNPEAAEVVPSKDGQLAALYDRLAQIQDAMARITTQVRRLQEV